MQSYKITKRHAAENKGFDETQQFQILEVMSASFTLQNYLEFVLLKLQYYLYMWSPKLITKFTDQLYDVMYVTCYFT